MILTGPQKETLKQAVMRAYTEEELEMLLQEKMDLRYEDSAEGRNYQARIFKLLNYLENEGRLEDFITAVREKKPRSPYLQGLQDLLNPNPKPKGEEKIISDPKNSEDFTNRQVFISYAWGGESEEIANSLEASLKEKGIELVRDKSDLGYKGLLKEFMQQIGKGNCVVTVISEKYLTSENCMYELLEISRNGEFYDRIFPIVLPDANIYDPLIIVKYIEYWENKIKELDDALRRVSAASTDKVRTTIDRYTAIRSQIDGLVDTLKDMNNLTSEIHKKEDFSQLIAAISERLKKDTPEDEEKKNELIAIWERKQAFLEEQEDLASNPAIKREIQSEIEECKRRLKEYVSSEETALSLKDRIDFLKLPLDQRRLALESQAEMMLPYYQENTEWQELIAGDIIDY